MGRARRRTLREAGRSGAEGCLGVRGSPRAAAGAAKASVEPTAAGRPTSASVLGSAEHRRILSSAPPANPQRAAAERPAVVLPRLQHRGGRDRLRGVETPSGVYRGWPPDTDDDRPHTLLLPRRLSPGHYHPRYRYEEAHRTPLPDRVLAHLQLDSVRDVGPALQAQPADESGRFGRKGFAIEGRERGRTHRCGEAPDVDNVHDLAYRQKAGPIIGPIKAKTPPSMLMGAFSVGSTGLPFEIG